MNVFGLLQAAAQRFGERGAVYRGERLLWTYGALHERALRLAGALQSRHARGSRVALLSENCPEYLELLFGSWAAGLAAVPVNAKLHPREVAVILEDCGASAVFASARLLPDLAKELAGSGAACPLVAIGGADYEALLQAAPGAPVEVDDDALAWLFYTSGTTGRSKGAMLSHRNLRAMTVCHLADVDAIDENASQIHAAPMSHGSGLYILPYVARGARQVIPESGAFDPEEFLRLCTLHPDCGAFLAPTMVQRLRLARAAGGAEPVQLRTIVYGGGPMYVEELRKSMATFGQVFVQIYGQGESPMTITWLRREDHASADADILGSVGCARTGYAVRVVDDQGRDLPCGETGEIVCRGDAVMLGYWNNPQASAEALQDGWLRTGDMGSLDERGYLTLRDRSKDVIISGGSNIYPREVEEALLLHPDVVEVCVVGQPDPEWGESVVAFVVGRPGLGAEALDAHCLRLIARFKRPKHYHFVAELPKNSYGKVLKRELRARLQGNH